MQNEKKYKWSGRYLPDSDGFGWIIAIPKIKMPIKGHCQKMIVLPQAAKLLIVNITANLESSEI